MSVISGRVSAVVGHFEISLSPGFRDCVKTREPAQLEGRHSNTEPRADRGPQPGSPAGVVDAIRCQSQPTLIQKPLSKASNFTACVHSISQFLTRASVEPIVF